MTRVLRALGASVVLVLILVGAPWLLIRWGRLEAVMHIPWRHLLSQPDNGDLLLVILSLVGWLAWAHIALTIASELVTALTRRRVVIPVPGPQWMRPVAGALVAALAGLVITQTLRSADAAPSTPSTPSVLPSLGTPSTATTRALPSASPTAVSTPAPLEVAPTSGDEPGGHAPAVAARVRESRPASTGDAQPGIYIVQPGDDLWTLAVTLYQDGLRWHDLAIANQLHADRTLLPGTVLSVPDLTQRDVSRLTRQGDVDHSERSIVVRRGDTLASLAKTHLGSEAYWPALRQANSTLVLDPDHLEPGWLLHLPPRLLQGNASRPGQAATGHASTTRASRQTDAGQTSPLPDGTLGPGGTALRDPVPRIDAPPLDVSPSTGNEPHVLGEGEPLPVPEREVSVDEAAETHEARGVVGGIAVTVLAGVGLGLARRRRAQLWGRPVGRRVQRPDPDAQRFRQAVAQLASTAPETAGPVSQTTVVVGERSDAAHRGQSVTVTLRDLGSLRVVGPTDLVRAAAGGIVTSISCAPWSEGTSVLVVGETLHWLHGLDDPSIDVILDLDAGLSRLERSVSCVPTDHRPEAQPLVVVADLTHLAAADQLAVLERFEPRLTAPGDVAVVWLCTADPGLTEGTEAGHVLILVSEARAQLGEQAEHFVPNLVSEPARRALVDLFDVSTRADTDPAPWWAPDTTVTSRASLAEWNGESLDRGSGTAPAGVLTLLPSPEAPRGAEPVGGGLLPLTRRPVTSDVEDTVPPVPEFLASADHPVLLLLGEVELIGARGPRPIRAVKQCEEYCAWILEHPGRTAVAMTRSLLVAEGTRRSNMSRLRTWLGADDNGNDYLPDAYSGHIRLHPGITTDWEQLRLLISAGVNQAANDALVEALDLVRGAPLADAAPGQWHWAEELRIDMSSTIRDIGAVLASRALAANDIDLARWAAARALTAAPEDELLMAIRVRTEHLAGNKSEVERLVLHITRQARLLGVDLSDDTVTVLQQAMEGRARARRA